MKSIAILTMVYEDDLYLRIWLAYWERFLPRSNLYVLIHADYDHFEQVAAGCNTIRIARPPMHADSDRNRWKMLSKICSGLAYMFDRVIYNDVDEIVALDPAVGNDPVQHILDRPEPVITPFAVDVVDPPELDLPPIDITRPILSQRPFVASSAPYAKPCIISEEIRWSPGGHYSDKRDIFLSDALTIFHLRLFDRTNYQERSAKRRTMVTDPETGKLIEGLAAPSWRRTNEFGKYVIEQSEPMKNIDFARDRKKWIETAELGEDGLWKRRGRLRKQLHRIPERFETVF